MIASCAICNPFLVDIIEAEVVLVDIEEGGHTWPGQQPSNGLICKSVKKQSGEQYQVGIQQASSDEKREFEDVNKTNFANSC